MRIVYISFWLSALQAIYHTSNISLAAIMRNRRIYRIVVTIACFVFAGMNAYKIIQGYYTWVDVFLLVIFLIFGVTYSYMLFQQNKES